jgi:hypothetical protein
LLLMPVFLVPSRVSAGQQQHMHTQQYCEDRVVVTRHRAIALNLRAC